MKAWSTLSMVLFVASLALLLFGWSVLSGERHCSTTSNQSAGGSNRTVYTCDSLPTETGGVLLVAGLAALGASSYLERRS